MKRINIFGVAMAAMIGFASCSEDFLTVYPPSSIMADDFYKTEDQIMSALVAAYAPINWESYSWGYGYAGLVDDIMAEDVIPGGPKADDNPYLQVSETFGMTSLTPEYDRWFGQISYSGVNRVCHVLQHLPEVQQISDANRKRIDAEARFLLSYYYYNLWRFFGNVPYYEVNLTLPYTTTQYSANQVYEACLKNIDIAIAGLPATLGTFDLGRANKAAAQMLKARFVMYQMDESRFDEVFADMKEIINSGQYALKTDVKGEKTTVSGGIVSPFEALYMDEGEFCSETIFDINYHDQGSTTGWGAPTGAGGTVIPQWMGPRELTINKNKEWQAGWGFAQIHPNALTIWEAGDTRKDATILDLKAWDAAYSAKEGWNNDPEARKKAEEKGQGSMTDAEWADYLASFDAISYGDYTYQYYSYLFLKKYMPRPGYNNKGTGTGAGEMAFRNNIRIFRYAETLLNAAELALRTGTDTGLAQGWFNQVRDRAFDVANGGTAPAKTATIDNIIHERRLEFMGDGGRYSDLVRTGKAETVLASFGWRSNATANGIKRYYWPIPNAEINNDTALRNPEDFVEHEIGGTEE